MDLQKLRYASEIRPAQLVDLVQPEINGGKCDAKQFSVIDQNPEADTLRVSGLGQRDLERLVTDHGHRFTAIEFWKCPGLEDLTPLEDLPDLRVVSFFWNQRTTRLWNLARTPHLRALRLEDFRRLHHLDDLRGGRALRELHLGDAIFPESTFATLEPLADLTSLRSLTLQPKRVDDDRVQPLGSLIGLDKLCVPANLFTTEQFAWLRSRLPAALESRALAPLRHLDEPMGRDGKTIDVLLTGRRKPGLNSELDAARIRRHVEKFSAMVAAFKEDPTLEPS
ncbi:hypothetical protein [Isoptericola sp. AK164]|uniref:hypothetical protein n=1 Tax=Isoptericola sp. AK164 TaxID=3024246 RepID=UPI002418854C|nr:hypothetical protein [Isoptericola sp. AK164]